MITIRELLNKIKWDPRENPNSYVLFYKDRFITELQPIRPMDILNIEGGFIYILGDRKLKREEQKKAQGLLGKREIIPLPLHRIKRVTKQGDVIWSRE